MIHQNPVCIISIYLVIRVYPVPIINIKNCTNLICPELKDRAISRNHPIPVGIFLSKNYLEPPGQVRIGIFAIIVDSVRPNSPACSATVNSPSEVISLAVLPAFQETK